MLVLFVTFFGFAGCSDSNSPTAPDNSGDDSGLPAAPSALNARNIDNSTDGASATGKVMLTWNDNADNETGFYVERTEGRTNDWILIKRVDANIEQFSDTGLDYEKWYTYRVCAFNNLGHSCYSDEVSLMPTRNDYEPKW